MEVADLKKEKRRGDGEVGKEEVMDWEKKRRVDREVTKMEMADLEKEKRRGDGEIGKEEVVDWEKQNSNTEADNSVMLFCLLEEEVIVTMTAVWRCMVVITLNFIVTIVNLFYYGYLLLVVAICKSIIALFMYLFNHWFRYYCSCFPYSVNQ